MEGLNLQGKLFRILRTALECGGVPKPETMTKGLRHCLSQNNNPYCLDQLEGTSRIAKATFSGWASGMDVAAYEDAINASLRMIVKEQLRKCPPDQRGILAADDPHEEQYYKAYTNKGRVNPSRARSQYCMKAHANNTNSPWANPWHGLSLTWWWKGHHIILPFQIRFMAENFDGAARLREIVLLLRKNDIPFKSIALDRGYHGYNMRQAAHELQAPVVYRVRSGGGVHGQNFIVDGQTLKLNRILHDMASDLRLPLYPMKDRSGRPYLERRLVVKGKFTPEENETNLLFLAQLTRVGPGQLSVDTNRSVVLSHQDSFSDKDAMRIYRRRWDIETFYRKLGDDKNRPACQTINSHVLFHLARVVHAAIDVVVGLSWSISDGPRQYGVARKRWSLGFNSLGQALDASDWE